mmetsp:Transcript_14805/g.34403  ORF Transcript_14805/g.34403 Transcript_14805/m.34403 type:complete len:89 (-) Transcript_14805:37-303(-)
MHNGILLCGVILVLPILLRLSRDFSVELSELRDNFLTLFVRFLLQHSLRYGNDFMNGSRFLARCLPKKSLDSAQDYEVIVCLRARWFG